MVLSRSFTDGVGSYAVGDVRALVPARKAVWFSPGEPKASGKLSSFYTFYRLYILFYTPLIICFMLIYSSIQLYYNLYLLLQPIFSLFFVFLALLTEVKPLCKSQFVTVQRIDVDVDDHHLRCGGWLNF